MVNKRSYEEIRTWLINEVARRHRVTPNKVDPIEPLANFAIDSVETLHMVADLEEYAGVALPDTVIWDYPTIEKLAKHVCSLAEH